jgi:hypothetical protein
VAAASPAVAPQPSRAPALLTLVSSQRSRKDRKDRRFVLRERSGGSARLPR